MRYFNADFIALCYATHEKVKNIIQLFAMILFGEKQYATITQLIFRFDEVEHGSAILFYLAQLNRRKVHRGVGL